MRVICFLRTGRWCHKVWVETEHHRGQSLPARLLPLFQALPLMSSESLRVTPADHLCEKGSRDWPLLALDRPIYSFNLVLFCYPSSLRMKHNSLPPILESAIICWCYIRKFIFFTEKKSNTNTKRKVTCSFNASSKERRRLRIEERRNSALCYIDRGPREHRPWAQTWIMGETSFRNGGRKGILGGIKGKDTAWVEN